MPEGDLVVFESRAAACGAGYARRLLSSPTVNAAQNAAVAPRDVVNTPLESVQDHSEIIAGVRFAVHAPTTAHDSRSEIPSHLGAVLPIDVAELPLEVTLFAPDHAAMHRDDQRNQHDEAPQRIEGQGEANIE